MRRCKLCKVNIPTFAASDLIWQKKGYCSIDCTAKGEATKAKAARERTEATERKKLREAKAAERKARRESEKAAKDRIKTLREWVAIAQRLINAIVVIEDKHKGCISCIDGESNVVTDSGHYFHRGNKYRVSPLTLLRANLNGQCHECNGPGGGKQHEYRIGFIRRYGERAFDDLVEFKRHCDTKEIKTLTIPQVRAMIEDYKLELKELKKRQP